MKIDRRRFLASATAAMGTLLLGPRALAGPAAAGSLGAALADSDLVYLTPLKADGSESRCQAEVWFVEDDGDAVVVTASDAWRARAVRQGLTRARVWAGDVGVWQRSDGAYRQLPATEARASFITDGDDQARLLERFGDKYSLQWLVWGPRFRNGLADGSRVMLRYRPMAA